MYSENKWKRNLPTMSGLIYIYLGSVTPISRQVCYIVSALKWYEFEFTVQYVRKVRIE